MFLASDAMRGRDTGSAEYDIAAQYVAAQFVAQGLRPAGDGGTYLQRVPLVSYRPEKGSMQLVGPGKDAREFVFGEDYLPIGNPNRPELRLEAPIVFVGQGVVGFGRDDYKGVDVRGKIVIFFRGAPADLPDEARAHFMSGTTKAANASARGAIGYMTLEPPPGTSRYTFKIAAARWGRAQLTWADSDGRGTIAEPGTPWLGTLSHAGAAKLFEKSGRSWDAVLKMAATDSPTFRPVELKPRLRVVLKTVSTPAKSYNVAGLLPGSDRALGKEVVVLSAHLDHVGIGKADESGDAIYNGAMDNAVGIASLIEEARRFRQAATPPRRSILFLAVTAEEEGLLGSDYFAQNPTVPKSSLVANINLDMPILTYQFEDVIPFGAEHSTLNATVRQAASEIGVTVSPDPRPEEANFIRSDHYSFVRQGIPSLFLSPGEAGPGKAKIEAFTNNHYHRPSDQIDQQPAIDWSAAVRFVDINYRVARVIANAGKRPMWKKGDLFGAAFGGPMEK